MEDKKMRKLKLVYLRSNVIGCSAECSCSSAFKHLVFTHSEIGDLNVTITIQHNIVQFQISAKLIIVTFHIAALFETFFENVLMREMNKGFRSTEDHYVFTCIQHHFCADKADQRQSLPRKNKPEFL